MGGTKFHCTSCVRRVSCALTHGLSRGRLRHLTSLSFVHGKRDLFVANPSNAKGDFVTATLNRRTYGTKVGACCDGTTGLFNGLGITGAGNALSGRVGGVRGYTLLVLSSLFLAPVSVGRHTVLLSVVRSERKEGDVVVASRCPMTS